MVLDLEGLLMLIGSAAIDVGGTDPFLIVEAELALSALALLRVVARGRDKHPQNSQVPQRRDFVFGQFVSLTLFRRDAQRLLECGNQTVESDSRPG